MPRRSLRVVRAAALRPHLDAIRRELDVPAGFPPHVVAEAERAAAEPPGPTAHDDARHLELVTLDPAGSTDLDQAVHLARADGGGYTVHYAIADVAAFVAPGGAVDLEAHRRGLTFYGADGRCPLHPEVLSEGAASLLPGAERAACLWRLDLGADGRLLGARVRRAIVASRAQLAYDAVQADLDRGAVDPRLALLPEVGRLRMARERARGGVSLPAPEQDVVPTDGGYALTYRASLAVESWNAQISLATGIAAARLMRSAGVGILRTLDPARAEDVARIRRAAAALAIDWAPEESYGDLLRRLDAARPRDAAFLDEATTMFRNAGYRTFGAPARDPDDDAGPGPAPHAAIGAEYAHVTAPLRRLVDRYGLEVCLAASSGAAVPGWVLAALAALPAEMVTAARRAGAYARAGIEAVEAAVLAGRLGETFPGVIVDVRAPKTAGDPWRGEVVLADLAVRALVTGASLPLGERVRVRLVEASLPRRTVRFERVG